MGGGDATDPGTVEVITEAAVVVAPLPGAEVALVVVVTAIVGSAPLTVVIDTVVVASFTVVVTEPKTTFTTDLF